MAKIPQGLVGTLTSKGFVKPSSKKKELSPQLAAAAARRLNKGKNDSERNEASGPAMSYSPGVQ